jgi:membrane-associated phospholipid phosphatase
MKTINMILGLVLFTSSLGVYCQPDTGKKIYRMKNSIDIPLTAVGVGWSVYCMTKVYNKPGSTDEQVLNLNKNNVNAFDRNWIYGYNATLDKESYYPFYLAFPLPIIFFLTGEDMHNDFWELTYLYLETLGVTGLFGFSATYFVDKYRPYTYDPNTPLGKRTNGGAKSSFYAGHVEVIAVTTFFMSEVYSDYYPDSKYKWMFYAGATAATAGMGYVRLTDGQHFMSDVLLGAGMGALCGTLVPHFHKIKAGKNSSIGFAPFYLDNKSGLSMFCKF